MLSFVFVQAFCNVPCDGSLRECGPLPFRLPTLLLVTAFSQLLCLLVFTCQLHQGMRRFRSEGSTVLFARSRQTNPAMLTKCDATVSMPSQPAEFCNRECGPLPFRLPLPICLPLPADTVPSVPKSPHRKRDRSESSSPWYAKILFVCLLLQQFRYGEALHPGPNTEVRIGTFSAGGLLHKGELLTQIPTGLWGVCETHLTHQGVQKVRDELKFRGCSARLVPGAPAPPLTNSKGCLGGKSTGVSLFSHFPIRALPSLFPDTQWNSSRIQVAAEKMSMELGSRWVLHMVFLPTIKM